MHDPLVPPCRGSDTDDGSSAQVRDTYNILPTSAIQAAPGAAQLHATDAAMPCGLDAVHPTSPRLPIPHLLLRIHPISCPQSHAPITLLTSPAHHLPAPLRHTPPSSSSLPHNPPPCAPYRAHPAPQASACCPSPQPWRSIRAACLTWRTESS